VSIYVSPTDVSYCSFMFDSRDITPFMLALTPAYAYMVNTNAANCYKLTSNFTLQYFDGCVKKF